MKSNFLIIYSEIDDLALDSLSELIALFTELEDLNLSNNNLTQLPIDLRKWSSIASLNLSNNQIEDF